MSAINYLRPPRSPKRRQRGVAAVEFALLALVFFTVLFGVIELSRLLFVYNTLQEVTRRAAAGAARVSPLDTAALDRVRQNAVFRAGPGGLVFGSPITDRNVRIEYMALLRDTTGRLSLTTIADNAVPRNCVALNRAICMANPNAANCIRFVKASICDTADTGECKPVTSTLLVPLVALSVPLHRATTIAPAESLGYTPGSPPCAEATPTP